MKRRQTLTTVLLSLAVGTTAWYVGLSQETALTARPFSATKTITSFSGTGEYVTTRLQHYAIRSDGSQVVYMTETDPLGQPKTSKTVFDVPGAVRRTADDLTETYVIFPMKRLAHSLNHRIKECAGQPVADERILGYDVVKTEEDIEIPTEAGGHFRVVRYLAPSLNCYTLKEESHRSEGEAPLVLVGVKEVVSVVEGEPDSSVFELPEGYTERTPIEMLREFGRRYPEHAMSDERIGRLRHLDDAHSIANAGR